MKPKRRRGRLECVRFYVRAKIEKYVEIQHNKRAAQVNCNNNKNKEGETEEGGEKKGKKEIPNEI